MTQPYGRSIFRLRRAELPWGDYGTMLVHGMSAHTPRHQGRLQIERTGPFTPPITLPASDVVVTEMFRRRLEAADFRGLVFEATDLVRIVFSDWEQWDRRAPSPHRYPTDGAPEGYVLGVPHDPAAASGIGDLWECIPERWGTARTAVVKMARPRTLRITVEPSKEPMPDFFRADESRFTFVSERAAEWLRAEAGEWVSAERVELA